MAVCSKCGAKLNGGEKFCSSCGAPIALAKKAAVKKDFSLVKFKWSFRDYQQKVLDNANKHLKDKKIHIVAAPGSGKTILGLELVRRLGKPALIMAPSVTIRQQWGERFAESYLPESENGEDYISYSLRSPKLITSVTYQALHAAFTKTGLKTESEEDSMGSEEACDFSDFELMKEIKNAGITTICLDEAHHLKSEWQKALEKFVELLGDSVNIISLTATPPYDSTPGEWNRYITLCGDIDEEIFVPQLVLQKTLCPHQDYVYFSYPAEEELELIGEYKKKAAACADSVIKSGILTSALKASGVIRNDELLYDNIKEFAALTLTAMSGRTTVPKAFLDKVLEGRQSRKHTLRDTEIAFEFIINRPDIFGEISEKIREALSAEGLMEKKKVCLTSTDKLNKILIASRGKLNSICEIAKAEYSDLGGGLRMLILTDYIRRELMSTVGTDTEIHTMGTVPVFESVRRACPKDAKIAVLTGTLVILPDSAVEAAQKEASEQGVECRVKPIAATEHSEVVFAGSNKNKVSIITKIFGDGYINILIGTKSLLGEGWDSPNINSLILASFVGSFMLSNQMRGRAIRIDKSNPGKISNIWHLVTLEPDCDAKELSGEDYEMLKRRFACFQAPAYSSNVIESGVERLDILKPPFDRAGIEAINAKMLELARDRQTVAERWQGSVKGKAHPEVSDVAEIPETAHPVKLFLNNRLHAILLGIAVLLSLLLVVVGNVFFKILGGAAALVTGFFFVKKLSFVIGNSTPEKSISSLCWALLFTLKDIGAVDRKTRLYVRARNERIECSLTGGTQRENALFSEAVREMLSPIDDPRYIIIGRGFTGLDHTRSYACPAIIGTKKENVELLKEKLRPSNGRFELVYTRNKEGRKTLFYCRRHSYLNQSSKAVKSKKTVR